MNEKASSENVSNVIALLFGLGLVGLMIYFQLNEGRGSPATAAGVDAGDAEAICIGAVQSVSNNADRAEFPYSPAFDNGETWRVLWIGANKAKLQNGFGAMIDTPIQCAVDKKSGKITQLLIAGETLR